MRLHLLTGPVSALLRLLSLAACLALASCGGGGGGGGGGSSSTPAANTTSTAGVSVEAAQVSISAYPPYLRQGETVTLSWSSTNAKACQASDAWGGAVDVTGTRDITPPAPGKYTYTVSCDGRSASASVEVLTAVARIPQLTLSLSPAAVAVGQPASLNWSSTDAASCTASGAWNGAKSTSGSIPVAPGGAGSYTYTLVCTSAAGTTTASAILTVADTTDNVAQILVDSGPAGAIGAVNVPYVNVTVCRPGTTVCQTIDHVVVDTGSVGLRIVSTALDPLLGLPVATANDGSQVGECMRFGSGFAWGPVRRADVKIAGRGASNLPIQTIGASPSAFANVPGDCSGAGRNFDSVAALNAKGILGIGFFKEDCGSACANNVIPGLYYGCSGSACSSISQPLASQVANPVAAFASDNNGVLLTLPDVPVAGASTVSGALVFGVGTQSNNQLGTAKIYAADTIGNFMTIYKGQQMTASFLDSGSTGLFFQDPTIPGCILSSYYCPVSPMSLTALNASHDGTTAGAVAFTVAGADLLAMTGVVRAAPFAANGPGLNTFIWGLPFFYGRSVFVAFEGASTPRGTGPYWAY